TVLSNEHCSSKESTSSCSVGRNSKNACTVWRTEEALRLDGLLKFSNSQEARVCYTKWPFRTRSAICSEFSPRTAPLPQKSLNLQCIRPFRRSQKGNSSPLVPLAVPRTRRADGRTG